MSSQMLSSVLLRVEDHEPPRRLVQLLLSGSAQLLAMLCCDPAKDLLRLLPIALEGDQHRDLVPDVLEALAEIGQR